MAECAECQAEVASFRETVVRLAETAARPPPAALRSSVLGAISQVPPAAAEELGYARRRYPSTASRAVAAGRRGHC